MTSFLVHIFYFVIVAILVPQTLTAEYKYNGGHRIPSLGLGTFTVTDEKELTDALNKALEIGYRHIDTAAAYRNEQLIGNVLKEWISSGKLKREEIFVTTKLAGEDKYPDKIENALKLSLEKLQLDYVDLYLIHSPISKKLVDGKKIGQSTDLISVWKKMEEQVDAGRTKTIGVSNFNISQIKRIQEIARIQPANLQVEAHVYFQQRKLSNFAAKNNITVVAYSPLGSPGYHKNATNNNILGNPVIKTIADKHNKSNAQIALRFLIESGWVVIPKSTNPKRLKENFEIFDFTLDADDMESLRKLDKGKNGRIVKFSGDKDHPEYPFQDDE